MIRVTELSKKHAFLKARKELEALTSDRKIEKKITDLERSSREGERLKAIAMRSILLGDTEESFAKACKVYSKVSKEKIRVA